MGHCFDGFDRFDRVERVMALLESHGIVTWLFGGWAEEYHSLAAPWPHGDIDLLYPAAAFTEFDGFLIEGSVVEIAEKRFPHKRAFTFEGTMTEVILVQPDLTTLFWNERRHVWPADVFVDAATSPRVASLAALAGYRAAHRRLHRR